MGLCDRRVNVNGMRNIQVHPCNLKEEVGYHKEDVLLHLPEELGVSGLSLKAPWFGIRLLL